MNQDPTQLINEINDRQDDVLKQIDDLNREIENLIEAFNNQKKAEEAMLVQQSLSNSPAESDTRENLVAEEKRAA